MLGKLSLTRKLSHTVNANPRHHLQHYAAHIHFSIERRRDSFQRSLEPYNLQTTQSNALELDLRQKRTSSKPSFIGIRAADHRASSKFGNDGFALDNWEHIEDEEDEDSFEISPYRNYTKVLLCLVLTPCSTRQH